MLGPMGNFRGWEWILILGLALLLFGGFKKLPDAARGVGRSLRIFKAETKGLTDDGDEHDDQPSTKTNPDQITADESSPAKSPVATPPAGESSPSNKN